MVMVVGDAAFTENQKNSNYGENTIYASKRTPWWMCSSFAHDCDANAETNGAQKATD
jgi:hypothetical protein